LLNQQDVRCQFNLRALDPQVRSLDEHLADPHRTYIEKHLRNA